MVKIIDTHVHLGPWLKSHFLNCSCDIKDLERVYKDYWGICVLPSDGISNSDCKKLLDSSKLNTKFIAWYRGDVSELRATKPDGVKLHPAYSNLPVTDSYYEPALHYAEAMDIPVFVHTGLKPNSWHIHPLALAKKYPHLKVVVIHMGGRQYQNHVDCVIDAKQCGNVWLDTTSRTEFSLTLAISKADPPPIMFGSDYPLYHPDVGVSALRAIDGIDLEPILYQNAYDLMWGDERC